MYTTYILYSKKINKFYTGQTVDIDRRLEEHNRGKTAFMKKGTPWNLVYTEECNTRMEAMKLERQIKKRGARRFLEEQGIALDSVPRPRRGGRHA